jgi:sugar-phosphatase
VIRAVLSSLDFAPLFRVVRSAEAELKGKPAPDVYLSAARELGVHPHRCLAFEDSPAGVLSALAAGMRVVAVPSATDSHLPVFDSAWLKLNSLSEFSACVM